MDGTVVAILGGTGQQGNALVRRWARAGVAVIIGSRSVTRAEAAAHAIRAAMPQAQVEGADLVSAAATATIVVLAVPYPAHRATLEAVRDAVQGKILVDVTVPMEPPHVARVALPPEGSAALAAQRLLGPGVRVVAAFHTVPAPLLADRDAVIDGDVLVCGDDRSARDTIVALARAAGLSALHGGGLANAAAAEALACIQVFLNGRYRPATSGIRFTGLARED